MKRTQVLATLALAFMLGVAVPVTAITTINNAQAWATESVAEPGSGNILLENSEPEEIIPAAETNEADDVIDTAEKLQTAINNANGGIVTLGANIAIETFLTIQNDVTINLNGFNITNSRGSIFNLVQGTAKITGSGTLQSGGNTIGINGSTEKIDGIYSKLVVDQAVTLKSSAHYGIAIVPTTGKTGCYGVVVDFRGKIEAAYGIHVNGKVTDSYNRPQITIADGASIITTSEEDGTPIYTAGTSDWQIGAANLQGNAAIGIRAGDLTFNNTTIKIMGNLTDVPDTTTGALNGMSSVFQLEHNTPYANDAILTVNGGTYTSVNADIISEYGLEDAETTKITLNAGTFTAGTGKAILNGQYEKANLIINGGTYVGTDLEQLADYLADGLEFDETGTVVKATSETPGGSTSGSTSSSMIIKNDTGEVSVEGNFKRGEAFLSAKLSAEKVAAFGLARYALYDINLTDAAGQKINPDGTVTVSIIVPKTLNGEKCNIYSVSDDLKDIKKLDSTYKDGIIAFKVDHFSYYAIVEDTDSNGGNIISTPETGTVTDHGVTSAVSTMMPILVGAGVMFALFGRKLIVRRRAEAMDGVECEIVADAKAIIEEAEAEPQIERFIATPMTAADEEEIKSHIFSSSDK